MNTKILQNASFFLFIILFLFNSSLVRAQITTRDKPKAEFSYYTLAQIKERFERFKIDSSSNLSEKELLMRIDSLQDLKPSTYRTYKAAVAYFAKPERLKEISDMNYGINSSIAIAKNKITYMRERKADSTIWAFRSQPIERIYDFNKKTFANPAQLDEVKSFIFAFTQKPNFEVHLLEKFLPTISQFGIPEGQRAVGYRMSLKDNYHLLIVDLPASGRKIILFEQIGWENIAKAVY